jgi:hypothetical protein
LLARPCEVRWHEAKCDRAADTGAEPAGCDHTDFLAICHDDGAFARRCAAFRPDANDLAGGALSDFALDAGSSRKSALLASVLGD